MPHLLPFLLLDRRASNPKEDRSLLLPPWVLCYIRWRSVDRVLRNGTYAMGKSKVIIVFGVLFLLIGTLLAGNMLCKFIPVLGGDSVLPNTIYIVSNFTLLDYLRVFLSAGFFLSGLYILLLGTFLNQKKKNQVQ